MKKLYSYTSARLAVLSTCLLMSTNALASDLEERVQYYEQKGWEVGVTVLDTSSNEMESINGDTRFHFNSTIKALACANVLYKVDHQQLSLADSIKLSKEDIVEYSPITQDYVGKDFSLKQACDATTAYSDNTAANYAISAVGGPLSLTKFMRSIGDETFRSDRYEPDLTLNVAGDDRDTTTTNAMTKSLQELLLGDTLSDTSKQQLLAWMEGNKVADGLLRASLPQGWQIADRSGASSYGVRGIISMAWSDTRSPLLISMYVRKSETSLVERDKVVADLGEVIFNKYQ